MISQIEIYHDDPAYAIKEKINEIVDTVNSLRMDFEAFVLNFDNHTHGYENSATGYPLITMVDERESDNG